MVLLGVRPRRRHARLARARPGDLPGAGDLGGRLAGRRRGRRPTCPRPPWPLLPGPSSRHRDDFDLSELRPVLDLRCATVPREHCTTKDRPGWLTLRARGGSLDEPDVMFVGRRQQHLSCRVRTLIDAGGGQRRPRRPPRRAAPLRDRGGRPARCGWSPGSAPLRTVVAARPVPAGPVVLAHRRARAPPTPHGAAHRTRRRLRSASRSPTARSPRSADARRPLPVDRGRRRLHRPGHRHVRRGRHRPLRLVRLRAPRRLNQAPPPASLCLPADRDAGRFAGWRRGPAGAADGGARSLPDHGWHLPYNRQKGMAHEGHTTDPRTTAAAAPDAWPAC